MTEDPAMACDHEPVAVACKSYTLTVEIQENGIIRDPFGFVMGRCDAQWLRRMLARPPYGLNLSDQTTFAVT